MERILGMEHLSGGVRDEKMTAERLRHRRAAAASCERAGLLRLCRPARPGQETRRPT